MEYTVVYLGVLHCNMNDRIRISVLVHREAFLVAPRVTQITADPPLITLHGLQAFFLQGKRQLGPGLEWISPDRSRARSRYSLVH